jgi:RNA polymerase sigma factor (sigma-70 family)
MKTVIRQLRRFALLREGGPTDGELLQSFLTRRDEAAFAALLQRHGPMVLGVCRRVLGNLHDAEDAFQATFLVLAQKAAGLRSRDLVGNWLYGVAYRTALKARVMKRKRQTREMQARVAPHSEAPEGDACEELLALLDRELNHLPDKYRAPVVLCELEGRSRREAARALGLPEGTLSWRLAQARKLLARKLARHGVALPAGALAAVLSPGAAGAALRPALLTATARAGVLAAAGRAFLAGAVPARVVALTEGVVKAMLLTKLKAFWVVMLAVSACVAFGLAYGGVAADPGGAADSKQPPRNIGRGTPDELEALRLELDALRKDLQAMRIRVKGLEAEVRGQRMHRSKDAGSYNRNIYSDKKDIEPRKLPANADTGGGEDPDPRRLEKKDGPHDPLAEVEAVLQKLRQNPDDRQAAEALERAARQLRQQPGRFGYKDKKGI